MSDETQSQPLVAPETFHKVEGTSDKYRQLTDQAWADMTSLLVDENYTSAIFGYFPVYFLWNLRSTSRLGKSMIGDTITEQGQIHGQQASGKVLLLSEQNNGGEPRVCLTSPVRNLADIGWGNRVEWAELRTSCPVIQPTSTPTGPKHEAKFYEEPNFANHTFTLQNPGTYDHSDLGHVDQFRKFYSVDLCSGCSIE